MVYNSAFHCTFIYWTKQNSNTDAEAFPLYSWYRALAHSASSSSKGRPGNWQQDRHSPQVHPRSFQHGQWPQQDREPEIQQWEHEPVIPNIMATRNGCFSLHTWSFSTNVAACSQGRDQSHKFVHNKIQTTCSRSLWECNGYMQLLLLHNTFKHPSTESYVKAPCKGTPLRLV